jgi:hypothetical protein
MPFSEASYDPETLAILQKAFATACERVYCVQGFAEDDVTTARKLIALAIMNAANEGEHDMERLAELAVRAIEGRGRAEL